MLQRKDFRSDTWDRLKAYLVARTAELDAQNRSFKLDATATASVRGRIAELQALLALETAPAGKGAKSAVMPTEPESPDEG